MTGIQETTTGRIAGKAAIGAVLLTASFGAISALADDAAKRTIGPESHDVETIRFEDVIGTFIIEVTSGGEVEITASGPEDKVSDLEIDASGDTLRIEGKGGRKSWSGWGGMFNWSSNDDRRLEDYPAFIVKAPAGTDLIMDDVAGRIRAGDLRSELKISDASLDGEIGDVESARIGIAGSGELSVGEVAGEGSIAIAGSGNVEMGNVGADGKITIAGSGDASMGTVAGGMKVAIAGSGDAEVESVNGPVQVAINGSGDVEIGSGRADPLKVSINGSGDMTFGGVAVDPRISVNGAGDVVIESYEGSLTTSGSGEVTIRKGK